MFYALARDARPARERGQGPGMFAALAVFRGNRRAWALTLFYFMAFGGFVAMFLYLPKLLTAEHDPAQGRRARGRVRPARGHRPAARGYLSDRVGAARILLGAFSAVGVLALVLAVAYTEMVPLTIACLTMAVALGLGTGAVFKLVPEFLDRVGSVTGVVGAAGGLGGFFPPLVMGIEGKRPAGTRSGFVLMARWRSRLAVLAGVRTPHRALPDGQTAPTRG